MKVSLEGEPKKAMSSLACNINSIILKEEQEYNKKLSNLAKELIPQDVAKEFLLRYYNLNMEFKRKTGLYYINLWNLLGEY